MLFYAVALAVATAAPMPVLLASGEQSNATAPAETSGQKTKEKIVCRRVDATGSRLRGHRVCQTEREREIEAQETRKDIDRARVRVGTPNV